MNLTVEFRGDTVTVDAKDKTVGQVADEAAEHFGCVPSNFQLIITSGSNERFSPHRHDPVSLWWEHDAVVELADLGGGV